MLRGMPMRMSSTSFARMISLSRARKSANGSAGMYSSGVAIIFISSLSATPMRRVPWSRARMRISSKCFENLGCHAHSLLNVLFAVRGGEKAGLKLRRCEIDARVQHAVEEFLEALAVALHRVREIPDWLAREVTTEHRATAVERHRHAGGFRGVLHPRFQLHPELFEAFVVLA